MRQKPCSAPKLAVLVMTLPTDVISLGVLAFLVLLAMVSSAVAVG
jgi:hypothetical protein